MEPRYDLNVESEESRQSVAGAWIFCVLYCAISFGMFYYAVKVWREAVPILITGFFAAWGVIYIVLTVRHMIGQNKFGTVSFLMERPAPSVGGQLRGSVRLAAAAVSARTLSAELTCWKETHEIGRNRSTQREPVWAATQSFPIRAKPGGASAAIAIDIPAELEPTTEKPGVLVMSLGDPPRVFWSWDLRVTADVPGVDLDRNYLITVLPVQPGAAPAIAVAPAVAAQAVALKRAPALRERDASSVWVLVAANLVAVVGAVFWGWAVQDIVFLYWMENLVIGAFNILRILVLQPDQSEAASRGIKLSSGALLAGKAMFAAFFLVHYGGFCFVHGEFLLSMFPDARHAGGLFAAVGAVMDEKGMVLAVLAIVASRGYSFLRNYIGRREYDGAELKDMMVRPYKRIFVTHIFIIVGGFILQAMKLPIAALVVFIAIKIASDGYFHDSERKVLAQVRE